MDINSVFPSGDLAREDPVGGSGQWAKKDRTFKISGHFLPQWKQKKNVEAQIMLFLRIRPTLSKTSQIMGTYFFLL